MADTAHGRRPRPYVRTDELAEILQAWLDRYERVGESVYTLADMSKLSPRAITKILRGEVPLQTVYIADKLLQAIGRQVHNELRIVEWADSPKLWADADTVLDADTAVLATA